MKTPSRLFCLLALLVPGVALGSGLRVDDAYIPEPRPGAEVAAAYFRVTNESDGPLAIVAFAAAPPAVLALHRSLDEEGIARMRPVGRLELAAGQALRLEPGGLHVMIEGVAIESGTPYRFFLVLEGGERVPVLAEVRRRSSAVPVEPPHHSSMKRGNVE